MNKIQMMIETRERINSDIIKELTGLPQHGNTCTCDGHTKIVDFIESDEAGTRIDAYCIECGGWLHVD